MTISLKVQSHHLERDAFLYIRQSSMKQVLENVESTKRQYALRARAIALGWPEERIVVIDCDQGESGASAAWREGFRQLVTDVGLGRAGIVMGLEVSRLARNNADWHRLLEICALANTLILDEDGVYDPTHFNDRLLLGLKGTMSEAELHVLKARLRGGVLNKVRRGEYRCVLPTGFVYDETGNVILDPDAQVRETIAPPLAIKWRSVQLAECIGGDANPSQPTVRWCLCLRPASVRAQSRRQEDTPQAGGSRLACVHPQRSSRVHHLGALSGKSQAARVEQSRI
jgi:DNA invertase Pin-like site-specific DNA recombinase